MPWYARWMLFVLGLWISLYGWQQLHAGVFAYQNMTYRQTVFSPGAIACGLFMMVLAFLPSGQWIYKRITTRQKKSWILEPPPHLHKKHRPGTLPRESNEEHRSS
jgi:hypothetical protein